PTVTFARGGQELVLGRCGREPVVHMYGSDGLGLAPTVVAKSDRLAGDGSIVRGVRYADREVFVPVLLRAATMAGLNQIRSDLYRMLAPRSGDPDGSLVDVRVDDPTSGRRRMIRCIY